MSHVDNFQSVATMDDWHHNQHWIGFLVSVATNGDSPVETKIRSRELHSNILRVGRRRFLLEATNFSSEKLQSRGQGRLFLLRYGFEDDEENSHLVADFHSFMTFSHFVQFLHRSI